MSRNQRFILLGLAAVVLVVAFVVARSGSSEEEGGSKSASDTTSTDNQQAAPTGDAHRPRKPAAPQVATIVVKGGKPVGGVKRITFRKNGQIVFVVRSDVADEVHFHGYDKSADVAKGCTVTIVFRATLPGRFIVELEKLGRRLVTLQIQ